MVVKSNVPRALNVMLGETVHRTIFPPNNYTVADNLLPDMRFTWKTTLDNNRFQFSDYENFSNLLIDESAPGEAYTIRSMDSGVYYWRIAGFEGEQQQESQARRLSIVDSLPSPQLNRASNFVAGQNEFITISPGRQNVDFSWQPSGGAEYYAFKLYKGDSSSAPVHETIAYDSKVSVNMSGFSDGSYTWTVQAFSRETATSSRRTGLSSAQAINIKHLRPVVLLHPYNGQTYTGIDASRNPDTARWSSQDNAYGVVFNLSQDARMRNIIYSRTGVPASFVLPRLGEGNYYWSIKAMTAEGLDISSVSPSNFRVLAIPPLPAPENRLPLDGHTILPEHLRASRSVDFSWDAVTGANGYMLTIFQGSGRGRTTVLQTPVLSETGYTVEDIRLLGRGNFFWQAEALYVADEDFIEQRGQLRENRLNVNIPAPQQIKTKDSGTLYGK